MRRLVLALLTLAVGCASPAATGLGPYSSAEMSEAKQFGAAGPEAVPAPAQGEIKFPAGFLWGAAMAAHQVEGRLDNDWSDWEKAPGNVKNGDTSEVGVDHYRRFDQDFALAAAMGHNSHRLSIEWSRLEPAKGQFAAEAIAHYHAVFRSLRAKGLMPMVTLHHFTNPKWIAAQGGWLAEATVADFGRFAAFAGREFGGEVDLWITINEPNVYAFHAYESGVWPPAHKSREEALRVMANLSKGHAAAFKALHETDRVAQVGIAHHVALFDPNAWWSPLDVATAYFNDRVFNRAFLKAVTTGELDFTVPGAKGVKESHPAARNSLDFLGVNYYTRWRCKGASERIATPGAPKNALGWEIYPEGLYRALKLANRFAALPDGRRIPLYITENGIDDRDGSARSDFLVRHLQYAGQAIQDGVDLRGYLHWTLLDNFEWAEGYAPRFGLYSVDRTPGADLARRPTAAVAVFKRIATANGVPGDLAKSHGR
ncbi:MAG: glycoside hydrolase family 1 protein [Candidatus Sericytochromatia bacterium]|nr:glycoside hydrolase family 1 protein [Candidatus Tanganyikabacteria bacterium]